MIYCYGDSLTEGVPGTSYVTFLNKNFCIKNCGLAGDTILDMTKRLKKKVNKIDNLIICIGINDILLPFFENYSKSWNIAVKIKVRKKCEISRTKEKFEENYIHMIELIKNKKVIIIGMPLLESNLDILNKKIEEYNEIIKKICKNYSITYIDLADEEIKYNRNLEYSIKENWFTTVSDVIITRKIRNVDELSKKRNLSLTVDGIHFNNVSASILANLIDKKINIFEDNC